MKSAIIKLFAVLLVLVGFQAAAQETKSKIQVMWWGSTATYDKVLTGLQAAFPDFFKKVEVENIIGGSGDAESAEKIRLSLSSGTKCADLIQLNYTQIPEFATAGVLQDLTDVYKDYQGKLTDAAAILSQYNGKIISVPNMANSKIYYYRKDIFDKCGIDPRTWKSADDMIAANQKIWKTYPKKYIMNVSKETGFQNYYLYMMMCAFDGTFVDANGNYIANKDPGLRKALETLKKIYDAGICYNCNDYTPDWEHGFASESIIGVLGANWLTFDLPNYVPKQIGKWAACLWPKDLRKGSEAGGSVMVIPNFVDEASTKIAKEYVTLYRLTTEGSRLGFEVNLTPILKDVYNSDLMKQPHKFVNAGDNFWAVVKQSYSAENFSIFHYTPHAAAEMDIFNAWATKYFTNVVTLDKMLDSLNADFINQFGENAFNK